MTSESFTEIGHELLRAFAQAQRLKIKKDECGDPVIPGKYGQVYPWNGNRLRVLYMPNRKEKDRTKFQVKWDNRRESLRRVGCAIHLDCAGEGVAIFDPTNKKQAALAIEIAACHQKKILTPEDLKGKTDRLAAYRLSRTAQQPALLAL